MRKVEIAYTPNDNKEELHLTVKLITDEAAAKEGPDSLRLIITTNNAQMKPAEGFNSLPHLSEKEMRYIISHGRVCHSLFFHSNRTAVLWLHNLD